MSNKSTLEFHGGAGHVTGANFVLDIGGTKLMFECGLAQGGSYALKANYAPFEYDPATIDVLFVTHAHADHIGRIPKLVKDGFSGVIYSTVATRDLAELMFEDALKILTREANKLDIEPLYSKEDIEAAFKLWQTKEYHTDFNVGKDVAVKFLDAGHILGSAMVELERNGKKFVFTGDLGNSPAPLLPDTEAVKGADYMLMESVYGDRNHEDREERIALLKSALLECQKKGGTLLIPAFSMQRTQILIYEINKLVESGEVPEIPVYLDSPLASKVTEVYTRYTKLFNKRVQSEIAAGDDIFEFPKFTIVHDSGESEKVLRAPSPKVIISASGMSMGGRVLMHERVILGDKKNIILFMGYQGVGTLGRRIQDGAGRVEINGKSVRVKAARRTIRGFSAHKDLDNMVEFVSHSAERLKKVFVVMGEPRSSLFLVQRLRDFLEVDAVAPGHREKVEIEF